MSSEFGHLLKISVFGQSHGRAIGVNIDGLPAGEAIDPDNEIRSLIYYPDGHPDDYGPYTLGEDEYFVVGDNVYNSHDSRDWNDSDPTGDVGPITGDMIVGRARFVFWPLSEIRSID